MFWNGLDKRMKKKTEVIKLTLRQSTPQRLVWNRIKKIIDSMQVDSRTAIFIAKVCQDILPLYLMDSDRHFIMKKSIYIHIYIYIRNLIERKKIAIRP